MMMEKDFNVIPDLSRFSDKKALVIGLDDALYPKRDFLLQIYYLFANFIEFTLHSPAAPDLLDTMKAYYETRGEEGLFEHTAQKIPAIATFKDNFDRLHHQAQLPLKLLLFPDIQELLRQFQQAGKPVFILTAGDPLMQLNKIKQIDWQGLEKQVKVYFEDELRFRGLEPLRFVLEEHNLLKDEVGFVDLWKTSE